MSSAGYCSACGRNVWLAADGSCQNGHGSECVSGVYDAENPASVETAVISEDVPKRRKWRTGVVVGVIVAALAVGCVVSLGVLMLVPSTRSLEDAIPHAQAMQQEHTQADEVSFADLNMNSPTASETVSALLADSGEHGKKARQELELAKEAVAAAPESATKTQWTKALEEYEAALAAHDEFFAAKSAFLRQLTVTGMCETEVPASISDLALALMFGVEGDPETFEEVAGTAEDNFRNLAAALGAAQQLEPAAGLSGYQEYCARSQAIAGVLKEAGAARKAGDTAKAKKLIAKARAMDASLEKDAPAEDLPPILAEGYADRFSPTKAREDELLSKATRSLQTLSVTQ
jgi:hypothetical protein